MLSLEFRALCAWLVLAFTEVLHGILRTFYVTPRIGDRRARRWAVLSGSLLLLIDAYFLLPWVSPVGKSQHTLVGSIWLLCMLTFDVLLGRLAFNASWEKIKADFDPRVGGMLGFGMCFLWLTPHFVAKIHGTYQYSK